MKPFSGKTNQNLQNGSIWNFARGSILEIGFEATFKSKTNVLNVWKGIFFFFFTFFSEQVENVFGGSKGKHKKLCKSEVGHRKHFRKWFWNYLEVKSRCTTEPLKKTIFIFCTFVSHEVETAYCESKAKCSKVYESKLVMVSISENGFEATR